MHFMKSAPVCSLLIYFKPKKDLLSFSLILLMGSSVGNKKYFYSLFAYTYNRLFGIARIDRYMGLCKGFATELWKGHRTVFLAFFYLVTTR